MIGGTERPLEARRAVPADRQKSVGEAEALFLTDARQPLAKGYDWGTFENIKGVYS